MNAISHFRMQLSLPWIPSPCEASKAFSSKLASSLVNPHFTRVDHAGINPAIITNSLIGYPRRNDSYNFRVRRIVLNPAFLMMKCFASGLRLTFLGSDLTDISPTSRISHFRAFARRGGKRKGDESDKESDATKKSDDEFSDAATLSFSESEFEFDSDEEDEDWDELERLEPAALEVTNEMLKQYWREERGEAGTPLVENDTFSFTENALPDDELWWNWRKDKPGNEGWSAWQKRPGNADAAMAAAAAEMGQIKLFGEKPSVAETALARTRKKVLAQERLAMEKRLREEMGDMAYYKQWVEGYDGETDKEEVERIAKERNEPVGYQIAEMLSHMTDREVRLLMATDARIERDPLSFRMTPKQVREVWGGDPVYPSINYIRDVDEVIDFRGPNFHEPSEHPFEIVAKQGRLITQEEIEELEKQDVVEEFESFESLDEIEEAIDIGEKDEDEDEEDE